MLSDVAQDVIVLVLRLGIVALLYAFLIALVLLGQRELRADRLPRESTAPVAHFLVVEPGSSGAQPGETIALRPVTRLGRAEGNTLVLDDEFVSAHHALVVHRDGTWWVRDDGSTNGTLVNGRPIDGETPLNEGDELQVGQVVLRLTR